MQQETKQKEERVFYRSLLILPISFILWLLYCVGGILPTKFLPPCFFHALAGFSCPGCGCTRAVEALFRGDILASLCYNPIILYAVLCYLCYLLSYIGEMIYYRVAKKFPSRIREGNFVNILAKLHSPQARCRYLYISIYVLLGFSVLRFFFELWQYIS